MDSGNSLFEPISKRPVCVVHKSVIENLGLRRKPERFRAIPYHSVGKQHGLLNGWMIECMKIQWEGQKHTLDQVVLAESSQLSEKGDYQMLLHPALLEEKKGEHHDFESCNAGKDAV